MSNDVLLVPINIEQPNVEAQSDVVVYVPQAHKNKAGIVKEGEGINIENGVVSLDTQTVEDMIDANKWVSYGFQQNLTEDEKGMARHNIGAGDNDFTGSYYDVTQKPHLNTDNTNSLLSGDEEINNTINLHKVSKTGSFNDLNDVPYETLDFAEAERQKTLNLFNSPISLGWYNGSSGRVQHSEVLSNTNLIDVLPNESYYFSAISDVVVTDIVFYNNDTSNYVNHSIIGATAFSFTVPSGANKIGFNFNVGTINNVMLTLGNSYVPYQSYNGAITHLGDAPVVFAESERQKSKNLWQYGDIVGTRQVAVVLDTVLKAEQEYTLSTFVTSSDTDSQTSTVVFFNQEGTYEYRVHLDRNKRTVKSFTLEQDCYEVVFYASYQWNVSENDSFTYSDIMITTDGSSDYQPYNGAIVHQKDLEGFRGKVLWTNPNPQGAFSSQQITLFNGDYDFLVYFVNLYGSSDSDERIFSVIVEKGKSALLNIAADYASNQATFYRTATYISETIISFSEGTYRYTGTSGTDASICVPVKIIGYKRS